MLAANGLGGANTMVSPFLGEAEHEMVRAELAIKRGG
jgi:hypothetical protein